MQSLLFHKTLKTFLQRWTIFRVNTHSSAPPFTQKAVPATNKALPCHRPTLLTAV